MKIGFIVDGQAEFRSLPKLYDRLGTPHTLLNPLYADIQPFAPVSQIVGTVKIKILILLNKGADLIIVLIDREDRDVCSGRWASELTAALHAGHVLATTQKVAVVVKNACYENWLISDPEAFSKMPKRFQLSQSEIHAITPNKADQVNAQAILRKAVQGGEYSKIDDAIRILTHATPLTMAANSRSFRRFLRQIEHTAYKDQSRSPAS